MVMAKDLDSLVSAMLAGARRSAPSDRVPYAFEQRVMAGVRSLRPPDRMAVWTVGLWRAALSSVAVVVMLLGVNAVTPVDSLEAASADPLETALLASDDPATDLW
jgi:anti-sigma-K factor RskA